MPTPNWGPQSGVPMDDATFDAYVSANPPGANINGVNWGGAAPWKAIPGMPATQNPAKTPEANYWSNFYQNGPNAVTMPQFQTGNQDQARLQQQQVIQDLQRQAAGDPNSLAQQQLQQGYGAAQAQQSSLGSTMRGQSAGAAMRGVQAGQQGIQRGYAGDQQMLQMQEQQAAQAMLAQLLAQQHGQDVTQATSMAQGANQGAGLEEAMKQFYAQGGLDSALAREQRAKEQKLASLGIAQGYGNLAQQGVNNAVQAGAGIFGGLATMGGNSDPTHTSSTDHSQYYGLGGDHG